MATIKSIEEKAKCYDEALEKARQLCAYPTTKPFIRDLQDLFPELAESEDERIRKWIIKLVKKAGEGYENVLEGVSIQKAIAWLEKLEIKEHDVCDTCDEKASCVNSCPMKLVEQKPTDKVEPIEGEFPYDNPADTLEGEIDNIWRKVSCGNRFTATKEGFEEVIRHFINFVKQKSAWSEEDESLCRQIEGILSVCRTKSLLSFDLYKKMLDFLKSLKDRVQPQLRQEWSEEDEEVLCKCLGALGNPNYCYEDGELECMRNWLKSLRPRSQWKPSKEQIYWLKWATGRMPDTEKANEADAVLKDLLADLKKLNGE